MGLGSLVSLVAARRSLPSHTHEREDQHDNRRREGGARRDRTGALLFVFPSRPHRPPASPSRQGPRWTEVNRGQDGFFGRSQCSGQLAVVMGGRSSGLPCTSVWLAL
jgi:hypothetical protein